ncbi:MAG TPA: T9SS type A sorting domain-containing protein [Bacteroidia bacterium]|nr:T9SS type A sorting domain-containing protein [Bacteroidia bacterium]
MIKQILVVLISTFVFGLNAQNPGDTIKISAFKYGSTTRDTLIQFPNNNLSFEKIILKYNMRCKNGLISNQTFPNQGCGEWDYSCNTYIVDSSKIENALNTTPSHVISNFSGTVFPYVTQPVFDYYNFTLSSSSYTINSETQSTLAVGSVSVPNLLKSNERSGHSQVLYTAAELLAAGFTPGNINGFILSVSNSGGTVNFMKVGIQHTQATALNASTVTLTGFTNVYNNNYTFVSGNNRIQFHTPFVWNGTDNILIDFSFTNTLPSNPVVFNGSNAAATMALYARNNYALDLSANAHVILSASTMSAISTEITVSFWAYGNPSYMPSNTSLIYGYGSSASQRNLNLHLPWSDNNMYFDCGYGGGGYDRINKVATASEQGGQWNHWAFTKNTATGVMNIYLNGALWHTGTAKTKPISILNLILGKDNNLANNWRGRINELSIWNKELSLTDIQTWMNKNIDATHPQYANLLAYYKMDEGSGLLINDSKFNLSSTGVNMQWTYDRGHSLNRSFFETALRPKLVFLKGNYTLATNTLVVKDSVQRNPNIVQQYSITSNATVVPMTNDAIVLVSTNNYYSASPSIIYDGDTGLPTGSIAIVPQGTITINNLNYYKRYPWYNEIMSFVTPYGKGLDMGIKGKSWFYDVTDFTPVLKGPKRLVMTLGGENQEQMDLDFWFIVGTPPRNVLDFNQLWQGAARAGGAAIASINNDSRFPIMNVQALSAAQDFKLRSTITGHGAEGEFSQNGGLITHYFNLNGGPNEFSWQITQECSFNVVYPQGGTWVYDRQGWCPGQTSLTKEYNLSPYITPGSTVSLDYNCSNPPNPSGDYRYLVANQLISYGGANHSLDAAIIDVFSPSNKVLYSRKNPICNNPVVIVRNTGSTPITDIQFNYWVNNANVKQVHSWSGTLNYMDTVSIVLPKNDLWFYDMMANGNVFHAEIVKVNFMSDQYSFNNLYHSPFIIPEMLPGLFTVEFRTNNLPTQNNYKIFDENGNVVGQSNFVAANTTYTDNYDLNGCYTMVVEDLGHDGLSWWANTGQGSGYVRIKNASGQILKTFNADFGGGFQYSFTTNSALSIGQEGQLASSINIYPNPAGEKLILQGELNEAVVTWTDVLGRSLQLSGVMQANNMEFNTSGLKPGIYFINIQKGGERAVKKVVKD